MAEREAVILGALLHDIGKFMQRAEEKLSEQSKGMENVICPVYKGRYTHKHVLWTNEFFEKYFPPNIMATSPVDIGNLACYHHRPDTPLHWIITEADCLSAGMDRLPKDEEEETKGRDSFKKTRLYSILEEVNLKIKKEKHDFRIEINPLCLEKELLFPKSVEDLDPPNGDLIVGHYDNLWQKFIEEFVRIPKGSFLSYIETLLFLLEKYTWCIPSSTMDLPDISLFDHSKTTAALAACLYDYHNASNTINETQITDRESHKYLLICGDLSGIQKFIYNLTSKGAAKGLKGRSFYLQLLAEGAAKYILREFNYPSTNVLYASGGKFYVLLANRYEKDLLKMEEEINRGLLKKYNGAIYLSLGRCALKGKDFEGQNFLPFWRKASQSANEKKRRKFSDLDYDKLFGPFGIGGKEETCDICRKEEIKLVEDERKLCSDCKDTEDLGELLSKTKYLIEVFNERRKLETQGFNMPFINTKYYLVRELPKINSIDAESITIYTLNSTEFLQSDYSLSTHAFGFKFFGGTVMPVKVDGTLLTFNDLAENSKGIKRLGILRMDVDNLGHIFVYGFGDQASISRVTTLSRSLSIFFNGYLNTICQRENYNNNIIIIYSGGDDLFIVGPWHLIVDLAEEISQEFRAFCCGNADFTLSSGIVMISKKYPIYRGAKHAGDAEEKAKEYKRNGKEKDAVVFLDKALSWGDISISREIKEVLLRCVSEDPSGKQSKGILNRLRSVYLLYEKNRKEWCGKGELDLDEVEGKIRYNKWLWRAVYSLNKIARGNERLNIEIKMIRDALLKDEINGKKSPRYIIDFIDVPIRWVEFLTRKEEQKSES
jgi:CRISPR-associated protein, Csm1 family